MKKVLLFLMSMLLAFSVFSQEFRCDGLKFRVLDPEVKSCEVTGVVNVGPDLVIPSIVSDGTDDYVVRSIGTSAFSRSGLRSVVINDSIGVVGCSAFYNCFSLNSVVIGDNVLVIKSSAFELCERLQSVTIGKSVRIIDFRAFYGCRWLRSLTMGNSVTKIGMQAFYECNYLDTLTIPESVKEIENEAFACIPSLHTVIYEAEDPLKFYMNIFSIDSSSDLYKHGVLYVPAVAIDKARQTMPWKCFWNIQVIPTSSVEEIAGKKPEMEKPIEVYSLAGIRVAESIDNLPAGCYIVRQGNATRKIIVN